MQVVRVAASSLISESSAVVIAIAGTVDDNHDVVVASEDLYRRLCASTGVTHSADTIKKLFVAFMGTPATAPVGEAPPAPQYSRSSLFPCARFA